MALQDTLSIAQEVLDELNAKYALIGGFALAAYGITRATEDIDLLVDGNMKNEIHDKMVKKGFSIFFKSDEVLQLGTIGQLDLLFANRPITQKILKEAITLKPFPAPVVKIEDLIGLKIQAFNNDTKREYQDKADILALLQKNPNVDYDIIKEYADLFDQWHAIEEIRSKL